MRTESVIRIVFQFGHLVIDPHWHDDAEVRIGVSADLCVDPQDPSYLQGPNFVTFRVLIAEYMEREIIDKFLVGVGELELLDPASEIPPCRVLAWPYPPTVETLTILVACEATRIAGLLGATVEFVELWESVRSGIRLDRTAVTAAVGVADDLLRSVNPSQIAAAYHAHNSLF